MSLAQPVIWRFCCTVICLLIGYPAAYFLASRDFSASKTLVVLILVPMWMNFLLRTYAMMSLYGGHGHHQHAPRRRWA